MFFLRTIRTTSSRAYLWVCGGPLWPWPPWDMAMWRPRPIRACSWAPSVLWPVCWPLPCPCPSLLAISPCSTLTLRFASFWPAIYLFWLTWLNQPIPRLAPSCPRSDDVSCRWSSRAAKGSQLLRIAEGRTPSNRRHPLGRDWWPVVWFQWEQEGRDSVVMRWVILLQGRQCLRTHSAVPKSVSSTTCLIYTRYSQKRKLPEMLIKCMTIKFGFGQV